MSPAQIHSPSYFSLCFLFFSLTLSIETPDCSSCLPSRPVTDSLFFSIYSRLSLYFVTTLRHQLIHPLNIFTEGLLCVIAQSQCPYFYNLLFTRENMGHHAWTISMETPTLPTLHSSLLYGETRGKVVCVTVPTSSPLLHSLNHCVLDAASTPLLKLYLQRWHRTDLLVAKAIGCFSVPIFLDIYLGYDTVAHSLLYDTLLCGLLWSWLLSLLAGPLPPAVSQMLVHLLSCPLFSFFTSQALSRDTTHLHWWVSSKSRTCTES